MIAVAKHDDHEWVTRQEMAKTLRLSVQRIDQLRDQFDHRWEKKPQTGSPRVLICQPDWLREWSRAESSGADKASEREFFGDDDAEWQDKCWEEKFYALRDDRLKRHEQTISREDAHSFMTVVASEIRQLGEKLQHTYGPNAQDMVDDTLDNIKHHTESILTNGNSGA